LFRPFCFAGSLNKQAKTFEVREICANGTRGAGKRGRGSLGGGGQSYVGQQLMLPQALSTGAATPPSSPPEQ